jgi:outer membrane receptor protein involved in Fe transport
MTRSRKRKLGRVGLALGGLPLASSILAGAPVAADQYAAEDDSEPEVSEILVVTAQKREEALQDVPLSITALGAKSIEELHITDFSDYAQFLPSVSFQTTGPGLASVYMRGVASGENPNHSGPQPTVGIYLDEQPVTTIQGALDLHMYDIARVESLAGPQGTLYGASSEAGTLRIITNKPDPTGFTAGYDVNANSVAYGGTGYQGEGFMNVPISSTAAVRLVAWHEHAAGYIDNVTGTRTFPTAGITVSNASRAKDNYNDVDTTGARAALRVNLNDSWTVTPTIMGQDQKTNGIFGFDPKLGDLKVTHAQQEDSKDRWYQAALTVQGKLGSFDVTYAGAYLKRNFDTDSDYSDYSYFYDTLFGYTLYNDDGTTINASQTVVGRDRYKKQSHELRISSPTDDRLRFIGGVFQQRQTHDIVQNYTVDGLASAISVTGLKNTIWLTDQTRVDRDFAVFGEASFDLTTHLTATGGFRYYEAKNSLVGFFGYGQGYSSTYGEALCQQPRVAFNTAPCTNLNATVKQDGVIPKGTLAYRFDDQRMLYSTFSKGFRPGGINRNNTVPSYKPDYLTNYEVGWKTTWLDRRLRFNGALFYERWKDFQFSFLPPTGAGLTVVRNAGQAKIQGLEADVGYAFSRSFSLSAGLAVLDSELTKDYCSDTVNGCVVPDAPKGSQLPVSPKFKSNVMARYQFPVGMFKAHVQGAFVYQGSSWSDLTTTERTIFGRQSSYGVANLAFGLKREPYSLELFVNNALDERAQMYRYAECVSTVCGGQAYTETNTPRTVGIQFAQSF